MAINDNPVAPMRAYVEELSNALVPLANMDIAHLRDKPDDHIFYEVGGRRATRLTLGDVRNARKALRWTHLP